MLKKNKKTFSAQNYIYINGRKKKRRKNFLFAFFVFLAVAFVLALFYFLFFSDYLKLKTANFFGLDAVKKETLQEKFENYLPKNIFLFSKKDFAEFLKSDIRKINNIDIKKKYPDSIDVYVVEYIPVGIVCNVVFEYEEEYKCFYFDKNGVVFDNSPFVKSNSLLFVYQKGLSISKLPNNFFSKEDIDFIFSFKDYFSKNSGILIDYFEFIGDIGDVVAKTKAGFDIFLTKSQPAKSQAEIADKIIKEQVKGDISNVEYIDLRIKNKAYIKTKQKEQ